MPVSETVSSGYIQLGVAGAALLIVLVSTILNSKQSEKLINASNRKVDKLCDKIDSLVTTITTDMVTNDKDLKNIKDKLDLIVNVSVDSQRRITRIDDRTFRCLGNSREDHQ